MILLARSVVCILLFCVPIILFAAMSRQQNAMLVILVPLFGAIPAIFGALILFAPVEYLLDSFNVSYLKNFVIPAVGGLLIFVFAAVMAPHELPKTLSRGLTDGGVVTWVVLGIVWGVVWRLTDGLAHLAGFESNA